MPNGYPTNEAEILIKLAVAKVGSHQKLIAVLAESYSLQVPLPALSMAKSGSKMMSDRVIKALAAIASTGEREPVSAIPALLERQRALARKGWISIGHLPPAVQDALITLSVTQAA